VQSSLCGVDAATNPSCASDGEPRIPAPFDVQRTSFFHPSRVTTGGARPRHTRREITPIEDFKNCGAKPPQHGPLVQEAVRSAGPASSLRAASKGVSRGPTPSRTTQAVVVRREIGVEQGRLVLCPRSGQFPADRCTHCHASSLPTKSADVVPASAAVAKKSLWPGVKADAFRRAVSKPVVASGSRNFPSLAEAKQGSTVRESLHAAPCPLLVCRQRRRARVQLWRASLENTRRVQ
jgi:hypothetical protein